MGIYYVIIGITFAISMFVSNRLKSKFKKYSQVPFRNGMTGKEVAEQMLRDNDIHDVKVISVAGQLTDHYNPQKKTVNLSQGVYGAATVSAAAVAAHECGHAVQHAVAYPALQMRSSLVPVVSASSKMLQFVLMGGLILMAMAPVIGKPIFLLGIAMFGLTTLFSFVTLPVEFDASKRALVWLENKGITSGQEHEQAKDALNWAARTYVVAALGSLAQLLYWVFIFMNRD